MLPERSTLMTPIGEIGLKASFHSAFILVIVYQEYLSSIFPTWPDAGGENNSELL